MNKHDRVYFEGEGECVHGVSLEHMCPACEHVPDIPCQHNPLGQQLTERVCGCSVEAANRKMVIQAGSRVGKTIARESEEAVKAAGDVFRFQDLKRRRQPERVVFAGSLVGKGVDMVNHPPHYNNHPSGVEAIQVTEHMNFCLGNVIKYVWRSGEKGKKLEDLRKARFYLNREIERLEKDSG